MKRKVVFLCFILLLFSMAVTAGAEELSSVSATVNSEGIVTISGKINEGAGRMVNIMVHDPNGSLNFMNTCLSGNDGLFRVSYVMVNAIEGEYTVTIGTKGAANVAAASFFHAAKSCDVTAVLEDGIVKVTGIAGIEAGRMIAVRITAPDGATEYVGNVTSGAGGAFGLSYAFASTQTGKYTVYAGVSGTKTPAVCYFLAGVKADVKAEINEQKLVTVEGIVSIPEKPVSVRITDPKGNTEYLSGIFSKADGTFSLSLTMSNEEKGRYTVSVGCGRLETPVIAQFVYGRGLQSLQLINPYTPYTPTFDGTHTKYDAKVSYATESISVKAFAVDTAAAKVVINGSQVTSGKLSAPINLNVGLNTIPVQVIEQDGSETSYTIHVTREKAVPPAIVQQVSSNASLSGIGLSRGAITGFSRDGTDYTVQVEHVDSYIRVTPQAEDAMAVIKVNGSVVASGGTSNPIDLAYGSNTISIRVTAPDGVSEKTYVLTVYRAYNLNLSALTLISSPGNGSINLTPSGTNNYTAGVGNSVTGVTVTPTAQAAGTTVIRVNGNIVSSGSVSQLIGLSVGENTITVTLTAPDNTSKTYTVMVTRARLIDASLSSLMLSAGELDFSPSTKYYEVEVPNTTGAITVTPTTTDPDATVTVNGQAAPGTVNLEYGINNLITVRVTATDGRTTENYTIRVNRPLSTDDTLSALIVSAGSLNPSFSPSVTNYTVNVDNSTNSVTITPVANNPNYYRILVDGAEVTSGSASNPINLPVGSKAIIIRVWPQSGPTHKDYAVTFVRAGSGNANLSALTLSPGGLNESFSADVTEYTAEVPNETSSITVDCTVADNTAAVAVSGASPLSVGANTVTVTVTAQNGSVKVYTITVTRVPSGNANLSSLTLNTGSLIEAFSADVTEYTANVPNETDSVTPIYTLADNTASAVISGGTVLNVGANTITVTVTAQNGSDKVYTITVTRAPSDNANLSSLTLITGSLIEAFSAEVTEYTANVPNETNSVTPIYTLADNTASVVISGGTALDVGANIITVTVTAQNSLVKVYTITVTRAPSGNANLSSLTLSTGSLNEAFSADMTEYTANVPYETNSLTPIYTLADNTASAVVNGGVLLNVGANIITITVIAQNGSPKVYTITVTRAPSGNANLGSLTLSTGSLSPDFSADVTEYTANVPNDTNSITLTTATADTNASMEVTWNSVDIAGNGEYSSSLNVGGNEIKITVTAENGTRKTYTVTITRAGSSNANLKNLDVEWWGLDPHFNEEDISYATEVYSGTESIQIIAEADDSNATVTVNGVSDYIVILDTEAEVITVTVTAQDGTTKDYFITVNRSDTAEPKYTIFTANISNGQVTADVTEAAAGATVNLTITSDDGYRLKEGSLKYIADSVVYTITGNSFTMPAANVAIMAIFEPNE